MPYEFKSITDIKDTNIISENLNLLAEQGGKAVRLNSTVIPKLDDTKVSKNEIWSSKKTINSLCPTLEEKEPIVKCLPLAESLLEVSSYIESKQEGTGTPSPDNICPISGWNDTIQLVKHGKNLIPFPYVDGGEGAVIQRNGITFTVRSDRGIKVEGTAETGTYFVLQRQHDYGDTAMDAMSSPTGHSNGKYTVSHRLYYNSTSKTLSLNIAKGTIISEVVYPQIEAGTVSTNYEPYQKDDYSVDLNETIYGSYYNWTTGTLTKTHEIITLTGNENFYKNGDRTQYYYSHGKSNGALINPVCSHFKGDYKGAYNSNIANTTAVRKTLLWLYTPQFNTAADLKAYLTEQYNAGTPVTIVYQVDEPISTPRFEPINIEAIDGENILYSNCGETKVKYDADIKKYIDKEEVYELIETITIEEEVQWIARKKEPNEKDYTLKAMMIKIVAQPATQQNGYIYFENGNGTILTATYLVSYTDAGNERTTRAICIPMYGYWYAFNLGSANNGYNNSTINNYPKINGAISLAKNQYIKSVSLKAGTKFSVGDIIEIWGVRANA